MQHARVGRRQNLSPLLLLGSLGAAGFSGSPAPVSPWLWTISDPGWRGLPLRGAALQCGSASPGGAQDASHVDGWRLATQKFRIKKKSRNNDGQLYVLQTCGPVSLHGYLRC